MAHGFLQSFDDMLEVFSAGTRPAEKVNSMAVQVMSEIGINITNHIPRSIEKYKDQNGIM
jgi:arsenate reductase